jgi:hypothetical protein
MFASQKSLVCLPLVFRKPKLVLDDISRAKTSYKLDFLATRAIARLGKPKARRAGIYTICKSPK